MQLTQLIQSLPPEQLGRMQTLMHNAMAGYDVKAEMEAFERGLPPGFREKLMALVASNPASFANPGVGSGVAAGAPAMPASSSTAAVSGDAMDMREARLTVLRGVAEGKVSPEDAERLLFPA